MEKITLSPTYRLLSSPYDKLKVFVNHYETPCMICDIMISDE